MYTDLLGKKRMKLGLHIHTTESDGKVTPEQAVQIYRDAGYDAIAITDHWRWRASGDIDGFRTISGAEYNIGGQDTAAEGVFHLIALGASEEPQITDKTDPVHIINAVKKAGGGVVLGHPAWSLNTVDHFKLVKDVIATEIYNTVSGLHASNRPDSSAIVDLAANQGVFYPLLATDDAHYYDGDQCVSYVMLDVTDGKTDDADIIRKISKGEFYATQGPEVHMTRRDDGAFEVKCSPASRISFYSQTAWTAQRNVWGENLTYAEYTPNGFEKWLRVEVTDADGKRAWSNIIVL